MNNPKIDIVVAGKNSETTQMTSTLAADAAGILERDYGIDAGEVLSMSVDAVETTTTDSKVNAADVDQILGRHGATQTWGVYNFSQQSGMEGYNNITAPPTTSAKISDSWDIAERPLQNGEKESVVLLKESPASWSNVEFLKNDAEWQDPSEYTEVTYKTTIGGDTGLQLMFEGGKENWAACGEAWWFFKLNESNTEGYAICLDNHGGSGACGVFERYWHQLYICHYDYKNPNKIRVDEEDNINFREAKTVPHPNYANNVRILKKMRISPLQVNPRYEITVTEKDGYATITVDPDEANAKYSYIGGQAWPYDGYFIGWNHPTTRTDATNNSIIAGIQNKGLGTTAYIDYFKNKDQYYWDWPGATQDAVTTTIKLSDSILREKTTQAFGAYKWNGTYFANNSVNVTKTVIKSFGDIVYEPTWTDGALHMLINIDTMADGTMLGSDGGTERQCNKKPSTCQSRVSCLA